MGDWLNQLGIGGGGSRSRSEERRNTAGTNRLSTASSSRNSFYEDATMRGGHETLLYTQLYPHIPVESHIDVLSPTNNGDISNMWTELLEQSTSASTTTGDNGSFPSDTLQLQHFGPLNGLIPIGGIKLGEGHRFTDAINPTWCDKCGDFIWGFSMTAMRCKSTATFNG